MARVVASVHARLQSFPQRWLRQLAAGGASSLPKQKAEKNRGKEKVSLPSEPGACDALALATGTHVGASDHAIALFVLDMVVSLGFVF